MFVHFPFFHAAIIITVHRNLVPVLTENKSLLGARSGEAGPVRPERPLQSVFGRVWAFFAFLEAR